MQSNVAKSQRRGFDAKFGISMRKVGLTKQKDIGCNKCQLWKISALVRLLPLVTLSKIPKRLKSYAEITIICQSLPERMPIVEEPQWQIISS